MAASPKVETTRSADVGCSISATNTDLTTVSKMPPFCPQRLVLFAAASPGACTLVPEDAPTASIVVTPAAGIPFPIDIPIKSCTLGANVIAVLMYWERGQTIGVGQFTPAARNA